jgi:hypothetical protein
MRAPAAVLREVSSAQRRIPSLPAHPIVDVEFGDTCDPGSYPSTWIRATREGPENGRARLRTITSGSRSGRDVDSRSASSESSPR